MNAEIIAAGSEMLTPSRVDTNSLWLTDQFNMLGIEVVAKMIVGDDRNRLAGHFKAALERADVVILTGGLGPTEDDVTRDAVAQALGVETQFRQEISEAIAERFARMGRPMAEINKRQAYVVDGFDALPNPNGTAPGLMAHLPSGKIVALLPGPPHELKPMFRDHCLPRIQAVLPPQSIATLQYRVAGMGESDLDQLIAPVYTRYSNPVTTILAKPGDVEIHLRARCGTREEAETLLAEVGPRIEELLGDRIYSRNGEDLETSVGHMLKARGATVSVAESCTGGLLGARFTNVAGSSSWFRGGFITYTNQMKETLLGVDAQLIAAHTEVSEPVALAMAQAARRLTNSTYALATTGYAGPDAGTEANPAGTVYVGLVGPNQAKARRLQFAGDRTRVRMLAATSALDYLRRNPG